MKTIALPDDVYDRILDAFADRIRELRAESPEETQEEWGRRVGVGQSSVCRWERAFCIPRPRKLCLIACTFAVSVDWLLGFSEARDMPLRVVAKARA